MVRTGNLTKGIGLTTTCLFALLLVIASCGGSKREEGVLAPKDFTNLLIDFYLTEGRLNTTPIPRDSAMKLFLPYEKSWMQKHHLTDEQLKKTYAYYLEHTSEFEKIYEVVIDTLSLREQRSMIRER